MTLAMKSWPRLAHSAYISVKSTGAVFSPPALPTPHGKARPTMVAYLDQAGVQHLIAKIRNTFWPVGTILATTSTTSPASYLGGSWEAYAPGRTLVGVDASHPLNSTGGSETHEVRICLGNIYGLAGIQTSNNLTGISVDGGKSYNGFTNFNSRQTVNTARGMDGSFGPTQVDFHTAISHLPTLSPYVAVCYWRRIA